MGKKINVTVKSSGNTNIYYKKKSQISYKKYDLNERLNREDLLKLLTGMKDKLEDGHVYKFAGFFNTTGYRDGVFFTKQNFDRLKNDIVYNFAQEYANADTVQTCKTFVLYKAKNVNAVGGNASHNDCLFQAIIRGLNYNYDLLPKEIKSGEKLKQYLNITRDAKVPIEKIKEIIPLLAENGISLQIDGDYQLDTEEKNININIQLEDEHYELKLENMTYIETLRDQMLKGLDRSKYDRQVYSYFEDKEKGKLYVYNGNIIETFNSTIEVRSKILYNFKTFMVKAEDNEMENMKNVRDYYVTQAKLLLKKTKGKVNLLRYRNVKCCALDAFLEFYKKLNIEVDQIDELEARWLYNFYHNGGGGMVYHENEYEGNFITIDENSAYPSTYTSTMMTPIKKPIFRNLKQKDLKTYMENGKECSSFTYGLYRCKVSYDETKNKLFKWKFKHDLYSHMDLKRAQELGLKVTLIEDGEVNAMMYEKESLFKSDVFFNECIKYFMDMKKEVKIAKEIVNCLSGAFAQINRKHLLATQKRRQNVDDFDSIIPGKVEGNHNIEAINMEQIFKYPFARQTIFTVNKWRNRLSELCEPVKDDIVRICTDSITLNGNHNEDTVKKFFKIGTNLKEFKIEMCGRCKIENSHIKYWNENENKYMTKKELKNIII